MPGFFYIQILIKEYSWRKSGFNKSNNPIHDKKNLIWHEVIDMKKLLKGILFLVLMIAIIDLSCKKEQSSDTGYHLGEPFQIKSGKDISLSPFLSDNSLSDSSLTVTFHEVLNDSRCAKAACYLCYGSLASISIQLINSRINLNIPITILGCQDEYNCNDNLYYKVDTLGYRICLLRLDPYPEGIVPINPSNYTAKLSISKH